MQQIFDPTAKRKATNLSVNSDLLHKARYFRINLSATLEAALVEQVRKAERDEWLEANRSAIDAANRLVETEGLFADAFKTIKRGSVCPLREPEPRLTPDLPLVPGHPGLAPRTAQHPPRHPRRTRRGSWRLGRRAPLPEVPV
jgi:antitoxin CcdA